jgi:1-acyl-sn-glycerol-3-phosphate acyltransferase
MARPASGNGAVKQVDFLWRLAATAFAFVALSVGGLLLALTAMPVAMVAAPDPVERARRAQHLVQRSFRWYLAMLQRVGVIRLEVSGADRLAACRGRLVVANHPTLLDVVLVISLVPNAQCVVKHQLWRHPLLGALVRVAGYIRNDLPSEELIARCRETLAVGNNLIIFPEGTRTVPGRPPRLQRGFAHIATLAGVNLQVIKISCSPITLTKGEAWYRIPDRVPLFRVEAEEVVEVAPFLQVGSRPLAARRLVSHLERRFAEI